MNSSNFRNLFFNEQNPLNESNIFKQKNLNSNMNLPLLTINSFDTGDYERDITNLNQKKINSHLKIKELEHQVQKAKIKFQGLLTKFEKYIKLTNKIKGTKTNSIHELIKDEKKIRSTSAYPSLAN